METTVGEDLTFEYFIQDQKSIFPFELIERKEVRRMAEKVLSDLPPREAEILRLRFGIGDDQQHTLEEVGRRFGVTRERVRQLEKRAFKRLRHSREKFSQQADKRGVFKPSGVSGYTWPVSFDQTGSLKD